MKLAASLHGMTELQQKWFNLLVNEPECAMFGEYNLPVKSFASWLHVFPEDRFSVYEILADLGRLGVTKHNECLNVAPHADCVEAFRTWDFLFWDEENGQLTDPAGLSDDMAIPEQLRFYPMDDDGELCPAVSNHFFRHALSLLGVAEVVDT
jgi:hypothetical protein